MFQQAWNWIYRDATLHTYFICLLKSFIVIHFFCHNIRKVSSFMVKLCAVLFHPLSHILIGRRSQSDWPPAITGSSLLRPCPIKTSMKFSTVLRGRAEFKDKLGRYRKRTRPALLLNVLRACVVALPNNIPTKYTENMTMHFIHSSFIHLRKEDVFLFLC